MNVPVTPIHLLRIGEDVPLHLLDDLAAGLARVFRVSCRVIVDPIDGAFAYDAARGQHHSTSILRFLANSPSLPDAKHLAVTASDLFVPVLTFVFGEAQLAGRGAVVSVCRLREEFYGLPPDPELLRERLLTEALHELGHTFGLRHCDDWRCAMASSHSVERIDLKGAYCESCLKQAGLSLG
jgi:archaemetzincin